MNSFRRRHSTRLNFFGEFHTPPPLTPALAPFFYFIFSHSNNLLKKKNIKMFLF